MILTIVAGQKRSPLWLQISIRYFRLAIPATASVVFAWVLLKSFPTAATELGGLTGSGWLQFTLQAPIPGLSYALYDGFVSIFVSGGSLFNNVLWTIKPEFIGSAMCFAIAKLRTTNIRTAITIGISFLAVASWKMEYLCFALGILLAEGRALAGPSDALSACILGLGLVVGSQNVPIDDVGLERWPDGITAAIESGILQPFAAVCVIYGCSHARSVRKLLSLPLPRFLGRISFPIYLLHVPLINTVLAYICLPLMDNLLVLSLTLSVWFVCLLLLSWLAVRFLDGPFLDRLGRLRSALGDRRHIPIE